MPGEERQPSDHDRRARRSEGNGKFAIHCLPRLRRWAAYLPESGLTPKTSSTDDCAGILAHKFSLHETIEALGVFAEIARGMGDKKMTKTRKKGVRYRWASIRTVGSGLPASPYLTIA
jgi:hypothetical protein